jgi:hypothetical protein
MKEALVQLTQADFLSAHEVKGGKVKLVRKSKPHPTGGT